MNEIENLETFYLIYLGHFLTNEIQEQLRMIINYLILFDNEEQCFKYIQTLSKNDRVILIINDRSYEQFLSIRQIISIYIYLNEININEQPIENSRKVNFCCCFFFRV